jgi:hypothetical protein
MCFESGFPIVSSRSPLSSIQHATGLSPTDCPATAKELRKNGLHVKFNQPVSE